MQHIDGVRQSGERQAVIGEGLSPDRCRTGAGGAVVVRLPYQVVGLRGAIRTGRVHVHLGVDVATQVRLAYEGLTVGKVRPDRFFRDCCTDAVLGRSRVPYSGRVVHDVAVAELMYLWCPSWSGGPSGQDWQRLGSWPPIAGPALKYRDVASGGIGEGRRQGQEIGRAHVW